MQYAARKKLDNKTKGHRIPNKLAVRGINKIQPDKKKIREEACTKAVLNIEKKDDELDANHSLTTTNVISENHNVGKYKMSPNGLVNSIQHYITSIAAKQFAPIANENRFIDSSIIDCYTVTHIHEFKNKGITYMPTDIANKAIGSFASQRKCSKSDMYKKSTPLKEKLLMANMYHGHSCL